MLYAFVNILCEMKISFYYMYCTMLRYCLLHSYHNIICRLLFHHKHNVQKHITMLQQTIAHSVIQSVNQAMA